MLYRIQIKLTSPWLGDQSTHQDIRRFRRYKGSDKLETNVVQWKWAIKQAAESLRMLVHYDTVQAPPWIVSPTLRYYTRKFRKGGQGPVKKENFEMIDSGTVLTFHMQVHSDLPGKKDAKPPSRVELKQLLTFVGRFVGLSPFGSTFDYGRFEVREVQPLEQEDIPEEFYR